MKIIASMFCCTLLPAVVCLSASASPMVTVNVTARVTVIDDPANIFSGQLYTGDVFTGSYRYDPTIPPLPISPDANGYQVTGNMAHVRLAHGAMVFETEPGNASGSMDVLAMPAGIGGADAFSMYLQNLRPLSNGATISDFHLELRNYSGDAPITATLPTTAPDLQDWPARNIQVLGMLDSNYFILHLQIESMTPDPALIVEVSPHAGRFLPQQRFDAVLLLPAGTTVASAQASTNGTPVSLTYPGTCTLAPPNSENRPAIVCPNAHTVLNPAATRIDWSVELASGAVLNKSVEWKLIQ